jgi:phosphoglycolate phosphatase
MQARTAPTTFRRLNAYGTSHRMATNPPQDVIFDFDGVLADSAPLIVEILDSTVQRLLGQTISREDLRATVGPPFSQAVQTLCDKYGVDTGDSTVREIIASFRAEYWHRAAVETVAFPGIMSALDTLASSTRLSICSSKPLPLVEAILTAWGLTDRFADIEAPPPEVTEPKAIGLQRLIDRMGAPASTSTLIGDTRFDLRAAEAVGVHFVGVAWGIDSPEELRSHGATTIADSPEALVALLAGSAGTG